ncbi:hypothetical protein [Kitasatospora herbaricolor]|uniref:hypothetical protein n=1 Tax=Kitasatospora herbaricolor TaxID=68217 RepID=UPI0036DEB45F
MTAGTQRRPKRLLAVAGAAALSLIALTACTGAGSGDKPAAVDGGGIGTAKKHVKITMMSNDVFAQLWQDQLVPEFNMEFP